MAPSGDTLMCRVHLCNRKAVPNSNLCDGHYRQLVDRALISSKVAKLYDVPESMVPAPTEDDLILESENRALWGDR